MTVKIKEKSAKTPDNTNIDQTPPPSRKKRGVYLKRPDDVRRLLCKLINKCLLEPENQTNYDLLRVVSYSTTNILKCFELGELADRIKRIEERIGIDKRYLN
jgi:hypothetical protein